jgi:hypothetical protein
VALFIISAPLHTGRSPIHKRIAFVSLSGKTAGGKVGDMDNRERERLAWILGGLFVIAVTVVGLLWLFGAFRRPSAPQVLPTPTVFVSPGARLTHTPLPTATLTRTVTVTRPPMVQTTTVLPQGAVPQREITAAGTRFPPATVVPGLNRTLTPAPPICPEPSRVVNPTETPIVHDGGIEAGSP